MRLGPTSLTLTRRRPTSAPTWTSIPSSGPPWRRWCRTRSRTRISGRDTTFSGTALRRRRRGGGICSKVGQKKTPRRPWSGTLTLTLDDSRLGRRGSRLGRGLGGRHRGRVQRQEDDGTAEARLGRVLDHDPLPGCRPCCCPGCCPGCRPHPPQAVRAPKVERREGVAGRQRHELRPRRRQVGRPEPGAQQPERVAEGGGSERRGGGQRRGGRRGRRGR